MAVANAQAIGSNVAWVYDSSASTTSASLQLVGVDPSGRILGTIDINGGQVLRSADGSLLCSVEGQDQPSTSTAIANIYSASTGALQKRIVGAAVGLGGERGFDVLRANLSSDGRYLVILHSITYVMKPNVAQVTKAGRPMPGTDNTVTYGPGQTLSIDERVVITGVEVMDVDAGKSVDYLPVRKAPNDLPGGQLAVGQGATKIYVRTGDTQSNAFLSIVTFNGSRLHLEATGGTTQRSQLLLDDDTLGTTHVRLRESQGEMVRFVPPYAGQWLDLATLSEVANLRIREQSAGFKGFPVVPSFDNSGDLLYLVDTYHEEALRVDLTGRRVQAQRALEGAGNPPGAMYPLTEQAAALSADDETLYVVTAGDESTVRVLASSDLSLSGSWNLGHPIGAVWAAPDNDTLYPTTQDGSLVFVVNRSTGAITPARITGQVSQFAT